MCGPRGDDLERRHQEVHRQIVREHGDAFGDDLQRVNGGEDGGGLPYLPFLAQQAVLEVAVPAPLAHTCAITADADGATDDQVDRAHLAWRDGATIPAGTCDAGGERGTLPETLRIDLDEALLGAQAGDGHVDD